MPDIHLIPYLNIFEVTAAFHHKNCEKAVEKAAKLHTKTLETLDTLDPQIVMLDLPGKLELENSFNFKMISSWKFWQEYWGCQKMEETKTSQLIKDMTGLTENRDHHPRTIILYGDPEARKTFFQAFKNACEADSDFILKLLNTTHEITSFRTRPGKVCYATFKDSLFCYEETENFYQEYKYKLTRLLQSKLAGYPTKKTAAEAKKLIQAYQNYQNCKNKLEKTHTKNIHKNIKQLPSQENTKIAILTHPTHHPNISKNLDCHKTPAQTNYKPFLLKNTGIEINHTLAQTITTHQKPEIFRPTKN